MNLHGKRLQYNRIKLTLMAIPFVVILVMFFYIPLFGWLFSFFDYKPGIPLSKTPFVGFKFFIMVIENWKDISRVLINTFALGFLNILTSLIPVIFALLLNELKAGKYKKLIQTATTIPNFISWVIIFGLAYAVFSSDGLYNKILMDLGVIVSPTNVLGDGEHVWLFQTALNVWKTLGWNAIIYLAAIAGIDGELYSAAKVDGAGRFRCVWHITVPGIMPTYVVILLLTISGILQMGFEQYFVFRNPMVMNNIEVLSLYVYKIGLLTNDYSYATAIGILQTFVSIVMLFIVNRVAKTVRGDNII